jgi:archaemetzincin
MGVVAHEVTHMFGVRHCIYYKCMMNGSNHLEESSSKPMYLCCVCLRKMQSNIKFDIYERYLGLRQFYEEQKDERVQKALSFVQTAIAKIESNMKL